MDSNGKPQTFLTDTDQSYFTRTSQNFDDNPIGPTHAHDFSLARSVGTSYGPNQCLYFLEQNECPDRRNLVSSRRQISRRNTSSLPFLTFKHNWYTKRALLSGVYTATELYMLTDTSKDFADTWAFLDNRLNDLVFASKIQADLEQVVSVAAGTLVAAISSFATGTARSHPAGPVPTQTQQKEEEVPKPNQAQSE